MSNENEAVDGGGGEREAPCASPVAASQRDEVGGFVAALAHLFDGAEPSAAPPSRVVETPLPAKKLRPLTLPKLRPRSARTLAPSSELPPRTYPRVVLPEAVETLGDTTMLGNTMFPPRRPWARVLVGATLVTTTSLVAIVLLAGAATSRADATPSPSAPARPAADMPPSARPAPPAPTCAAAAPLSTSRVLPAGPRRAPPRVATPPLSVPCAVEPHRAAEKSTRRLFGTED
jgi:hypothetical protein